MRKKRPKDRKKEVGLGKRGGGRVRERESKKEKKVV